MGGFKSFIKAIGSLWLAVVLLMLLLVTMAAATVFEAVHGTQRVQVVFYKAGWFQILLALLGLNILAAMIVRFPFSRRQIGMVITHSAILVVLLGACVTKIWGIDGQLGLWEEQTTSVFQVQQECLMAERTDGLIHTGLFFDPALSTSPHPVDLTGQTVMSLDDLTFAVERYLPDSDEVTEVKNDNSEENVAVEVVISAAGQTMSHWIFTDDEVGERAVTIKLHLVDDPQALTATLEKAPTSRPASQAILKVAHGTQAYEYPLELITTQPVPIGDSGYSVRVLRYMPHAIVENGGIRNASARPINPAVEAEIAGPGGTTRQLVFARFPDFQSMHGHKIKHNLKLTLEVGDVQVETAVPIEVYTTRTGQLGVRFTPENDPSESHELVVGQVVETPWPGISFEIHQRYDHARIVQTVIPAEHPGEQTMPAILVNASSKDHQERLWLRKGVRTPFAIDETNYILTFTNKTIPLGFDVTLDRFRVGKYPGTDRPRSFESQVTFTDPAARGQYSRVISMNAPATHGNYTFYQSSYDTEPGGKSKSVLSVAWDPGQPIVFIGYVCMLIGMIWVLASRMIGRHRNRLANSGSRNVGEEVSIS